MKPHKHAEIIKAWADGAEIQHQGGDGNWYDSPSYPPQMIWYEGTNYRIKPEPISDVWVHLKKIDEFVWIQYLPTGEAETGNIKITYDGETGEPKSAEVLK